MISGQWTGTMNLTEPQAGSDLSRWCARGRARRRPLPHLAAQKIFITYGEHDMAENIVHLVLARTPDAPEGVKGISLFVVPKFLVNDGRHARASATTCSASRSSTSSASTRSPTAVLAYGDDDGAIGYLVGEENRGLEYMFIMMNAARFAVGMEGVAIAERAYQHALAYAQGRACRARDLARGAARRVPIIHHPDVRRMLMTMKAQTEAMRALAYVVGARARQGARAIRTTASAAQPGASSIC